MKYHAAGLIFTALLAGCIGLGGRTSYVKAPNGSVYEVRCQSDGKVSFKDGAVSIDVDNRGPLAAVWAAGAASIGKIYHTVKGEEVK